MKKKRLLQNENKKELSPFLNYLNQRLQYPYSGHC